MALELTSGPPGGVPSGLSFARARPPEVCYLSVGSTGDAAIETPRVHHAPRRSGVIVRMAIRGIDPSSDEAPADHLSRGKRAHAYRKAHRRLYRRHARARLHRGPRL